MKKNIELNDSVIEILQTEADIEKRPLKNHMEYILEQYSKKISIYPEIENKLKQKIKK